MSVDEEIFKKLQLEKKAIKMPYHLSKFSSSQRRTRNVEYICFMAIILQIWCEY
jgi:hypothetical protein